MGFATIDNSKSARSTNSKFAHKNIGVKIEKMQKNEISKFWSKWVLPNDGLKKSDSNLCSKCLQLILKCKV